MDFVACSLKCECGGTVSELVDNVMYILTEDHQIIFRGACPNCGQNTQVTRDILSLVMLCPSKKNQKGN